MDSIIAFISYMTVVSVSTERLVELIKNFTPFHDRLKPKAKAAYYQTLAVSMGALACWVSPPPTALFDNAWLLALTVGLMASGGSGLWHDFLEILIAHKQQIKSQRQPQ